ncbi:MAG: hypothetical protein IT423_19305 [Pirellulaceae bacterium]|nr:hypothetical protein [Pirellulaceae bacterium]
MPWFDPPVPYDPPWPPKLQVFGMPSMAIGMSIGSAVSYLNRLLLTHSPVAQPAS